RSLRDRCRPQKWTSTRQPLVGAHIFGADNDNPAVDVVTLELKFLRGKKEPRRGETWTSASSMTVPQEIAVSLIVAVCAAATGRLAWSVVEFVYGVLN